LGAAHDDSTATEASPISATARARSSISQPPTSSDALGPYKVAHGVPVGGRSADQG
jgi:hypothetical protein